MKPEAGSNTFNRNTVAALIPAYLEEAHISDVVARTRRELATVLVIDDGSKDRTSHLAKEAGAEVIAHAQNQGKGAAIKTGFRALMQRGFEYVLLLDGDGQHLPEEIARFIQTAEKSAAGIYLGNRMSETKAMPLARRLTNQFMSWQISRLCGQDIPDTQCGFRMIHREVVPMLYCESNAYDYETEMLLIASRAGQKVVSVPVTTVYGDEKSKIHPVRDGIRFLKLISRYSRKG